MYRLQQQLVSWACDRLADIAEINAADVAPSLLSGSIVLNNLSLRTAKLNKLLPIQIASGTIASISISAPWLTRSVQPLEVVIDGAKVIVGDLFAAQSEALALNSDEIAADITEASILGVTHDAIEAANDPEGTENASDDEDEFHSCKSDSDTDVSDSDSDDAARSSVGSQHRHGIFRSVVSSVAHYVAPTAWTAPRTVLVSIRNCEVVLSCDVRAGVDVRCTVGRVQMSMEPSQETVSSGRVRVTTLVISDIKLVIQTPREVGKLVEIPSISVTVTATTNARGVVVAQNTAVDGRDITLYLEELNVDNITRCALAQMLRFRQPSFARHLAHLRRNVSWWPFAAAAVRELVRDRRRRWNFSLSHLRVFTVARRSYLEALSQCHREGVVDPHRSHLVALEQDLVYRDVVAALRSMALRRHERLPAVDDGSAATGEVQKVATSIHVQCQSIELRFPASCRLRFESVAAVSRDSNATLSISSFRFFQDGRAADIFGASKYFSDTAVRASVTTSSKNTMCQIELRRMEGDIDAVVLCESFRPLVVCALHCLGGSNERNNGHQSGAERPNSQTTVAVQLHALDLRLAAFCVHLKEGAVSVVTSSTSGNTLVVGCSSFEVVHELCGAVVQPITVTTVDRVIRISAVKVLWSAEAQRDVEALQRVIEAEQAKLLTESSSIASPHYRASPARTALFNFPPDRSTIDRAARNRRRRYVSKQLGSSVQCELISIEYPELHVSLCCRELHVKQATFSSADSTRESSGAVVDVSSVAFSMHNPACSSASLHVNAQKCVAEVALIDDLGPPLVTSRSAFAHIRIGERGLPLVELHDTRLCACGETVCIDVRSCVLAKHTGGSGACAISRLSVWIQPTGGIPDEYLPYNASIVSIAANIDDVHVPRVREMVEDIGEDIQRALWDVVVPTAKMVMSVSAQRLFQNGLSDLQVQISAGTESPAIVVVSEGTSIGLSVGIASPSTPLRRGASSQSYFSSRASTSDKSPVVRAETSSFGTSLWIRNDCARFNTTIALDGILVIELSPSPDQVLCVAVEGASVTQPMTVLEHWNVDKGVTASQPKLIAEVPSILVGLISAPELALRTSSPDALPYAKKLMEMQLDKLTVFGSCADAAETDSSVRSTSVSKSSQDNTSDVFECVTWKFGCGTIRCDVDVVRAEQAESVLRSWTSVLSPLNAASDVYVLRSQHQLICSQPDNGYIWVGAAGKVIVVDESTFSIRTPIIVREGSHVVFRHCAFRAPSWMSIQDVFQRESDSCTCVLQECTCTGDTVSSDLVRSVGGSSTVEAVAPAAVGAPQRTVLRAGIPLITVNVVFHEADVELRCVARGVGLMATASAASDSFSATMEHLSVVQRVASCSIPVCPSLSFAVECSRNEIKKRVLAQVRVSLNRLYCSTEAVLLLLRQCEELSRISEPFLIRSRAPTPPKPPIAAQSRVLDASESANGTLWTTIKQWTWKLEVSCTAFELSVGFPSTDAIVTAGFSPLSMATRRERLTDSVELAATAAVGVEVWDRVECKARKLLREPLSLRCSGEASLRPETAQFTVELGVLDFLMCDALADCLKTIRSWLAVPRHVSGAKILLAPSTCIVNETGLDLMVRFGSQNKIWVASHQVDVAHFVELPIVVETNTIPDCRVVIERFDGVPPQRRNTGSHAVRAFVDCYSVEVELSCLSPSQQTIYIRPMVSVRNALHDCDLALQLGQHRHVTVPAQESRGIPIPSLDDHVLAMRITRGESSSSIFSCGTSARVFAQRAVSEGHLSLGAQHRVTMAGEEVILDVVAEHDEHTDAVSLVVLPGRPDILNDLPFSVTVCASWPDDVARVERRVLLAPRARFHLSSVCGQWSASLTFSVVLQGATYYSSESVESVDVGDEETAMVMLHAEHGKAQCFELTLLPVDGTTVAITAQQSLVVSNCTSVSFSVTSPQGTSVGSISGLLESPRALSGCQLDFEGGSAAVVPANASIVFCSPGTSPSEPVSFSPTDGSSVVFCSLERYECCGACFVTKLSARGPEAAALPVWDELQIVPYLTIRNEHTSEVELLHTVVPATENQPTSRSELYASKWTLPPGQSTPIVVVAATGFHDVFQFRIDTDTSTSVVCPFLPETHETVVLAIGQQFHAVTLRKGRSCDACEMTFSAPQAGPIVVANLTLTSFGEVRALSAKETVAEPRAKFLTLTPQPGLYKAIHVPLEHNWSYFDETLHVSFHTSIHAHRLTVRITDGAPGSGDFAPMARGFSVPSCHVVAKTRSITLAVEEKRQGLVSVFVEAASFWASLERQLVTAQFSLTRVCVKDTRDVKDTAKTRDALLAPFCFDASVRDASCDATRWRICVNALCIHMSKVDIFATDSWIAAMIRYGRAHAAIGTTGAPAQHRHYLARAWQVLLTSFLVSEVKTSLSWSRDGSAEDLDALRSITALNHILKVLVGSLRGAPIVFPTFHRTMTQPQPMEHFMEALTQSVVKAVVEQAHHILGSYEALGAPISFAGSLITGLQSTFMNSFFSKSLFAPLSLFVEEPSRRTAGSERDPNASSMNSSTSWLCRHCARVHGAIEDGVPLESIAKEFGLAALCHHTSRAERLECMVALKQKVPHIALILAVEAIQHQDVERPPISIQESSAPTASHGDDYLITRFTWPQLVSASLRGVLPPLQDPLWERLLALQAARVPDN